MLGLLKAYPRDRPIGGGPRCHRGSGRQTEGSLDGPTLWTRPLACCFESSPCLPPRFADPRQSLKCCALFSETRTVFAVRDRGAPSRRRELHDLGSSRSQHFQVKDERKLRPPVVLGSPRPSAPSDGWRFAGLVSSLAGPGANLFRRRQLRRAPRESPLSRGDGALPLGVRGTSFEPRRGSASGGPAPAFPRAGTRGRRRTRFRRRSRGA